ncbi:MAG: hypothetical protein JST89_24360 [Cyanobacteria bacterium SZAS-4]|nr:hypothetical protein [Cyanobacteria bacterium SZAS-4]
MTTINHLFQLLRDRSQPTRYQFLNDDRGTVSFLPDGTRIVTDENERMVQVEYGTGAKVVRHQDYVMVQAVEGSFWFGNSQGQWYQFD